MPVHYNARGCNTMAVTDAIPGKNKLQEAMSRAGAGLNTYLKPRDEPMMLSEELERRPIRRVDAKLAILHYVDSVFRQRTSHDGSVLGVSREQLIEDLTGLIVDLDNRALEEPRKTAPAQVEENVD